MSKKDEALKLALEALEMWCPMTATYLNTRDQAITAIRSALAEQPEVWVTPKLRPLAKLAKELDGVVADVEQGDGFDDVCLDTVKYVRDELTTQPAQQELEELTAQRDQLADILTRTANALKGQPAELSSHSWHDLPEVAQQIKAAQQQQEPVAWAKHTEKKLRFTTMPMDHEDGWRPLVFGDTSPQPAQQHEPAQETAWQALPAGPIKVLHQCRAALIGPVADGLARRCAVAAIDAELARPAQQQEPVAYASDVEFDDETEIIPAEQKGKLGTAGLRIPLYIDPPASKPWVGLTDEEIIEHFQTNIDTGSLLSFAGGARYAEAKLKEKNT